MAAKEIHHEGDTRPCTNNHGECQFHKVYHDRHWVCDGGCCQNPMSDGIAARMAAAMASPSQPVAM